jgi:hypothetical protein
MGDYPRSGAGPSKLDQPQMKAPPRGSSSFNIPFISFILAKKKKRHEARMKGMKRMKSLRLSLAV